MYKSGKFNDLQLPKQQFTAMLLPSEKAVVDRVYSDAHYFANTLTLFLNRRHMKNIIVRHENFNQRIKSFQCMRHMFRHLWKNHDLCFEDIN